MIHITSLKLSRLLVEKGATIEPNRWHWVPIFEGKELIEKVWGPEDHKPSNLKMWAYYPAYTFDQMPAVLEEVGKAQGWGIRHISINNYPIAERGMLHHTECIKCVKNYRYVFLRFCEIFANGHDEESWRKAEEYLMGVLK